MYKDENHYTLYRRGEIWGYYWYDSNNKRHYRSTGKKTKHEAQKVINKRIAEGDLQWKEEKKDVLFKDYAANFFIQGKCPILKEKERTGKGLSPTTIYNYRKHLTTELLPFFGEYLLGNIDDVLIKKYEDKLKEERGLKHKTINQIVFPLRASLDQAVRDRKIDRNPFDLIVRMKDEESDRTAFTVEQVQRLLGGEWKSEMSRIAFEIGIMTGLRIGEIQALRVRSIKDDMIEISENYAEGINIVKDTKNHKTRYIPFPEPIRRDIEWLMQDKGPEDFLLSVDGKTIFSRQSVRNDLKARMVEEGMVDEEGKPDKNLTFHSTRHFFDSYLYLKAGVDKEKIMKVIGHQSEEMFRRYLHVRKEDLDPIREAQNKILKAN